MRSTRTGSDIILADNPDITGRGILVTGGTTGIGRAAAVLLASHGAHVLIFGRHENELNDAMNDLREVSDDVYGIIADVAEKKDIQRVFAEAYKRLECIDVLVNNAGLAANSVTEGTYDDWEYIVRTNLLGYMACANEAISRMKEAGGGHIVNGGSMSAEVRGEGSSVYVATKAGIQGFSAVLRKEVNRYGIKVSLIEPGSVSTDMQPEKPREQWEKEQREEMLKAEDIAACIHYCLMQPKRCDVVVVQIAHIYRRFN